VIEALYITRKIFDQSQKNNREKRRDTHAQIDGFEAGRSGLREAIRRRAARFAGLRARFAVRRTDKNRNGVVDDEEVEHLIELSQKEL
jgi:hypothetical protein